MVRTRLVAGLLLAGGGLLLAAPGGSADEPSAPGRRSTILVAEVSGVIDPVTEDLLVRSLDEAEREPVALFLVTVDSPGSLDIDVTHLLARFTEARVPVAVWVEAGGGAEGAATLLLQTADVAAVATDATVGPVVPVALDDPGGRFDQRAADDLRRLAGRHDRGGDLGLLLDRKVGADAAVNAGLVDVQAPTLRDLIAALDGREVTVAGEARTLDLGEVIGGGEKRVLPIRFRGLGLGEQLQHALTSPFVALLLLVSGLCLIAFEFFAVGIGIAATVGAGLVAAAFVGFGHLPVDPVGLGLVVGGVVAVSIDVQAGAPRFWATAGAVMLTAGAFGLYDGAGRLDPPWWQVTLVVAGALLFLLPGLAAVTRARFSSPTIGRDSMIGEEGTATETFDPEGIVTVRGAPWRARATRVADITAGDRVRVTAVRGLVLEVEPVSPDESARGGG